MIPAHIDENTVKRSPSEVNEITRVLRKMVIKLDHLMETAAPLPSAEQQEIIMAKNAKADARRQRRKEGRI